MAYTYDRDGYMVPLRTGAEVARKRMIECLNMDRRNVPVFRFRKVRSAKIWGGFVPMPMTMTPDATERYKRSRKAKYRWEQRL